MDIFCATPSNPTAAINFDVEACDQDAKQPFHMDNCSCLHLPLLTQLFTTANASSSQSVSHKWAIFPSSTTSTTKRTDVPCCNWNWGRCQDPCPNCCKHGTCCICGEDHSVKDNDICLATLWLEVWPPQTYDTTQTPLQHTYCSTPLLQEPHRAKSCADEHLWTVVTWQQTVYQHEQQWSQ